MAIENDEVTLEIAGQAFSEIQNRFPHLQMIDDTHVEVDLSRTFPVQIGLRYEVHLNVQNRDELHFRVSQFWVSWFPCTQPECAQRYADAVSGFLSGDWRIVEYYCNDTFVKAKLQCPMGPKWKTMSVSYGGLFRCLLYLDPWATRHTIPIRND